jgi:glutamate dehydrogenase/leucine dehydrogenase
VTESSSAACSQQCEYGAGEGPCHDHGVTSILQHNAQFLYHNNDVSFFSVCAQAYSGPPKLVVFGGRGFVGSAVCKEALNTGLHVVAISPSGGFGLKIKRLTFFKRLGSMHVYGLWCFCG